MEENLFKGMKELGKEEGRKEEQRWRNWRKRYRVFLKKVLNKGEEKIQEKMKMTWQRDENLVQVQQQCSVYFWIKTFFKS